MLKLPVAVGLKMCRQVVIEETTRHVTLVNCLRRLAVESFPSAAKELVVCAILTDGLGEMDLTLEIASLVSMDLVHSFTWKIKLGEALRETSCHLKLNRVVFPEKRPLPSIAFGGPGICRSDDVGCPFEGRINMDMEPGEIDDIVLEANWANFTVKPLEGSSRKKAEEYLEKLKADRPEEYAAILQEREARKRRNSA
jgi:hypothetical protein